MKVYFVRHGKTDRNIKNQLPIKNILDLLNEEGRGDARHAETQLPEKGKRIMYSSFQPRAEESALIILAGKNAKKINPRHKLIIKYDDRIGEVDFGDLGGKNWEEVKAAYPGENLEEKYKNQEYDFKQYNGESYEMVKRRLYSLINEVKQKHSGDDVVIFSTHAGVIRVVYKEEKGITFQDAAPENGKVHVFEF